MYAKCLTGMALKHMQIMHFCDCEVQFPVKCNSTAELTFDVNVCCVVQYIHVETPEQQLIECALKHNTLIFLLKKIMDTFQSSTIKNRTITHPYHKHNKGGITHTVSPNLMIILSTYRVVLHPSYLQKVLRKIQLYDSLRKQPSSWRLAVGGAKEWRALKRRSPTKQRHLMPFHLPSAVLNHDRDLL